MTQFSATPYPLDHHPAFPIVLRLYTAARTWWRASAPLREMAATLGMSERNYADRYVAERWVNTSAGVLLTANTTTHARWTTLHADLAYTRAGEALAQEDVTPHVRPG